MPDPAPIHPGEERHPDPSPRNTGCRSLLIGGLFLLLQGCATAPTPATSPSDEARMQAKISYLLSDYQRTLAIVLPKAEAGEPWAQYTLGYMYYYGRGVTQNRQTAKRWIESAAAKGYAPAQQAMQRLSAPPPSTEDQNGDAMDQGHVGSEAATPPPDAQHEPTNPQMSEPIPSQAPPPPAPMIEPSSSAIPATTQDNASVPDRKPGQAPASSPPAPQPIPPQASTPSANAEAAAQSPPAMLPDQEIKGRDWISRQAPRHYTLQLASSLDEAAIIRLIRKQGIEQQAAYYSTMQKGKKWYSLLYGNFASHSAAYQAMRKLPRALRRDSPRIRSFREIHSQLSPTP